ncbi:MAG: DUF2017 family protein [Jatrophihabitans sp.]
MKVRRRGGRLQLVLVSREIGLMQSLLDEMTTLFGDADALDASDPVLQRLFPSAYRDDEDAEADYRSMTESGLRNERVERIAACAGELAAYGNTSGGIDLADPDVSKRWIQVLNDIRLALGIRLGVSEDGPPDLDPTDPGTQQWLVYHWLTGVQDSVVTALMA